MGDNFSVGEFETVIEFLLEKKELLDFFMMILKQIILLLRLEITNIYLFLMI